VNMADDAMYEWLPTNFENTIIDYRLQTVDSFVIEVCIIGNSHGNPVGMGIID